MGLAIRRFLLDRNDDLHRLPNAKFEQMFRDSKSHRIPRFAGARVRMTDVIVELVDRQPLRVVWTTFSILTFDSEGYFDPSAFDQHQRALAESALAPLFAEPSVAQTVVDAASRFLAKGGSWTPSRTVARRIDQAALGRVKCPRL